MNDLDKLFYQLELAFGKDKLGEFEVMKKESLGDTPLLHISPNPNIEHFYPRFSPRVIAGEDTSIPRLSTCRALIDCIIGLNSEDTFGVYTIYEPQNWKYAVIPSKKLLPDVNVTEEHWLIHYDTENRLYPTKKLGIFFLRESSVIWDNRKEKSKNIKNYHYCLKLFRPLEVLRGVRLEPGNYQIELHGHVQPYTHYKLDDNLHIKHMTEQEFNYFYSVGMGTNRMIVRK